MLVHSLDRLHSITALFAVVACFAAGQLRGDVQVVRPQVVTVRKQIVKGADIAFRRFPPTAGISQTRVSQITQDDDGFLWFGTQSGLNRYDGYKCKVFKHDPRRPGTLSGVYLYALFKDSSGKLWAGSDQYLDRFDPVTETFNRVQLHAARGKKSVNFGSINQDRAGMLWLPTSDGLYGLNPATSQSVHYSHDPNDPASLNRRDLQSVKEDRSGALWVGMWGGLDLFDSRSGKVTQRISIADAGLALWTHEDRFGVFWVMDGNGILGILDRQNNRLTRFSFDPAGGSAAEPGNEVLAMLEDRDGTMWFGTANRGLLKYSREQDRFISYTTQPGDDESLPDNRVITLFQDREGNIWAGLHQTAPVFFNPRAKTFQKFTFQPGNPNSLGSSLVSVIHQDAEGTLWIGADRLIKRIDRNTGRYSTFPDIKGHEVLSIVERGDILWMGTGGLGLKRYDRKTGRIKTYLTSNSRLCGNFGEKLMMDRKGRLWQAAWGGLCYLDPATERFNRFDSLSANRTYHAITEDRD
ncbi:MAG TPA: two-component regulator propeller domain-containing protein, partial [Bryobacteraceae bacterium]|nr:two-component regulator propeller domain-containing protein [Bryobacteraceae bacterium]